MKTLIYIPTENFGVDITDKFQDFFKRLQAETKSHLISNTNLVCGAYELETIKMFLNAFKEMQIIPDNATNGDIIRVMFPSVEVKEKNNGYEVYFGIGTAIQYFSHQWWNAPYKKDCIPSEYDLSEDIELSNPQMHR